MEGEMSGLSNQSLHAVYNQHYTVLNISYLIKFVFQRLIKVVFLFFGVVPLMCESVKKRNFIGTLSFRCFLAQSISIIPISVISKVLTYSLS